MIVHLTVGDVKQSLFAWKDRMELVHKLLSVLNSYTPPNVRNGAIGK